MDGTGSTTARARERAAPRRWQRALPPVVLALAVALLASSCILNGSWTMLPPVVSDNGNDRFLYSFPAVSCVADDFCMVGGANDYGDDPPPGSPTTFLWDGTGLTPLLDGPEPDGTVPLIISELSCGNRTTCAAQVAYAFAGDVFSRFAVWDGTSWIGVPLVPAGQDYDVNFDCAPDGTCLFADDRFGTVVYDGTGFTEFPVGQQATPPARDLNCFDLGNCFARDLDNLQRWDGQRWQVAFAGPPRDLESTGVENSYRDMACTAPTNCLAVGTRANWRTLGGTFRPIAAHFDGSTWTMTPVSFDSGVISQVSCAGPAACMAVGGIFNAQFFSAPVAIGWIGNQWLTLPAIPLVYVSSTSCAGERCLAVGEGTGPGWHPPVAATYDWRTAPSP